MNIKVNNCDNCPFMVVEIDFNSVGNEVLITCNLLKFLKIERINNNYRSFDYEEWCNISYLKSLEKCPLKKENKIEINYE